MSGISSSSVASFRCKSSQSVTIRVDDRTTVRSRSLGVGSVVVVTSSINKDNNGHGCNMPTTTTATGNSSNSNSLVCPEDHIGQHPALNKVCVMDCMRNTRIVPNSDTPFPLSNDCFDGHVMLLMRTPDVDGGPNHNYNNTTNQQQQQQQLGHVQKQVSEYFHNKKRRFEFQFQIKLKKVPTGPLFLGCELEHSIKVGGFTKTLVGLLLAMVRRINPGFHYSWGTGSAAAATADNNNNNDDDGNYEKTHLSFPVEASMDRIVISKPGDTIPTLGEELFESPESVKRRRKMGAGSVAWNTEDTFTMCLWSAYCDWIQWKSFNVPGVAPFALSRVTGAQPIYLCVYEITACKSEEYKKKRPAHKQKDLKIYSRLEFSNIDKTCGGLAERLLGRRKLQASEHSIPDTESVGSDVETVSRVSLITN